MCAKYFKQLNISNLQNKYILNLSVFGQSLYAHGRIPKDRHFVKKKLSYLLSITYLRFQKFML